MPIATAAEPKLKFPRVKLRLSQWRQKISTSSSLSRTELTSLARHFHTKKRLGQHFLVEPIALGRITESLSLTASDTVIEIGPGLGFLTRFLSETGAKVTAVELDREAVADLGAFALPNVSIVHADFLAFDLASVDGKFKVVGNVPYQITTPIVCRLFGEIGAPQPWFSNIEKVVLTVQFEVAERFVAQPNTREYSQITLLCNYFCDAKILFPLSCEEFFPRPQVNSAVVEFIPRQVPPIECSNIKLLRQLIKAGFSQRRKMLRNNLSFLKLPDQVLSRVFRKIELDPQIRAERLSLQTFAELANGINELMETTSHSDR